MSARDLARCKCSWAREGGLSRMPLSHLSPPATCSNSDFRRTVVRFKQKETRKATRFPTLAQCPEFQPTVLSPELSLAGAGRRRSSLFVFNDTTEEFRISYSEVRRKVYRQGIQRYSGYRGPRAPAVKPGRVTQVRAAPLSPVVGGQSDFTRAGRLTTCLPHFDPR